MGTDPILLTHLSSDTWLTPPLAAVKDATAVDTSASVSRAPRVGSAYARPCGLVDGHTCPVCNRAWDLLSGR